MNSKENAIRVLENIEESFRSVAKLNMHGLTPDNTVLVNVDVINGFVKEGVLASPRVEENLKEVVKVNEQFKGYRKIFFVDSHKEGAEEFKAYPPHCLDGSEEVRVVAELEPYIDKEATICYKNSVNGIMSTDYRIWEGGNIDVSNFVVVGYVTDICVMSFANAIKAKMNEIGRPSRVIVPMNAVETFELEETNHNAELMNLFALYNMRMNGVEIVTV